MSSPAGRPAAFRCQDASPAAPSHRAETILQASRLSKAFGARRGLRAVDLAVSRGERVAVVGANGAGKSTLVRLLALLIRPTSGSLEILGRDAVAEAREVRASMGVALHDALLYPDLTVAENLAFTAQLYGVPDAADRVALLLDQFALSRLAGLRVRYLSRGQRQRVSLARVLVNSPSLVLLDEPDTALDAEAFDLVGAALFGDSERTILFTTHRGDRALELGTRLVLLEDGRAHELGATAAWTPESLAQVLAGAATDRGR